MTGDDIDLEAIMSGAAGPSGVPHGETLVAFVEAVLADDAATLAAARRGVRNALGDAALVDAAATLASFNAVVKVADGSGIPLEPWKAERTEDLRAALALDAFRR